MDVSRWDEREHGEPTEAAVREELRERGFRVSKHRYPPGTTFPPHTHDVEKIDAVLEGRFKIGMGGDEVVLEAGDWVRVPEGAEHTAEVVGDETVVSLDAVRN